MAGEDACSHALRHRRHAAREERRVRFTHWFFSSRILGMGRFGGSALPSDGGGVNHEHPKVVYQKSHSMPSRIPHKKENF